MTEAPAILAAGFCVQPLQRLVDPASGGDFIVQIAFDAVGDAGAAQGGQAFIDAPADLAELRVGAIAQGEDGIPGLLEPRRSRPPAAPS